MYCRMISARRCLSAVLIVTTVAVLVAARPLEAQQPRWPATEPQAGSGLAAPQAAAPLPDQQYGWPPAELRSESVPGATQPAGPVPIPQGEVSSASPETAVAPSPDRRLLRQVYTTCDGTYHLNFGQGTAHVELGGRHWLVPLAHEKNDLDHDGWRYRVYRHDRGAWPCYVWGFGMDPVACQGYAVWTGYQPAQGAKCVWLTYRWGSRLVTEQQDPVPPVPAPPE